MKINRTTSSFGGPGRRRRNPLALPAIVLVLILIGLPVWFWARGGEQPQHRVEKVIPAERLGH
jgi:hypothetical protein